MVNPWLAIAKAMCTGLSYLTRLLRVLLIRSLFIMAVHLLRQRGHRGMVASPGLKMITAILLLLLLARGSEPVPGGHAKITCMTRWTACLFALQCLRV